jgi:hypothetical protein
LGSHLHEVGEPPALKLGLPYPSNIRIDKRSDSSCTVAWDPPAAPISISQSIDCEQPLGGEVAAGDMVKVQTYSVYLNHELYAVVGASEECAVLVEGVDLAVPNRVSVQANVGKDVSSKPQECTLLFGKSEFGFFGSFFVCLGAGGDKHTEIGNSSFMTITITLEIFTVLLQLLSYYLFKKKVLLQLLSYYR